MFFYLMFNYTNDELNANVLPDKKTTLKVYFGLSDVSVGENESSGISKRKTTTSFYDVKPRSKGRRTISCVVINKLCSAVLENEW